MPASPASSGNSAGARAALQHLAQRYRERVAAFYDQRTGNLLFEDGDGVTVTTSDGPRGQGIIRSILAVCAARETAARPRVVFWCGGATLATAPAEAAMTAPGDVWAVKYQFDNRRGNRWAEYTHGSGKDRVVIDVRMSAPWFGDELDGRTVRRAYLRLRQGIHDWFYTRDDRNATLLSTPAGTGMDLLVRSLPTGYKWPAESENVAAVARKIGQGRLHHVAHPERPTIPGVYVLDARWMYASCLRRLPVGPATYNNTAPTYVPFRNAFYHVRGVVPRGWAHVGLLPATSPDGRRIYPYRTGEAYDGWVTGAELEIALDDAGGKNPFGAWPVEIVERVLFAEDGGAYTDPARAWIDQLRGMREELSFIDEGLSSTDQEAYTVARRDAELLAAAVRNLTIQTIGLWYRGERQVRRATPLADAHTVPSAAEDIVIDHQTQRVLWYEPTPLTTRLAPWYRPSWAAMVWGRSRAKLIRQALTVPYAELLSLRHDSLVLTYDPRWPDRGRPGDWRVKHRITRELPCPQNETEYRELLASNGASIDEEDE